MTQQVELDETPESIHPLVALKADWINDARQMMRLRRLHLAQEWNIPLSLITDPSRPPPAIPVTINQTANPSEEPKPLSKFAKSAICAGIAVAGIGLPLGGYFIGDAIKSIKQPAAIATPSVGNQYDLKIADPD